MTSTRSDEPLDPSFDLPEAPPVPGHRWGFGAFLVTEAVLLASAAFVSALFGKPPAGQPLPVRDVLIGTITPTVLAAMVAVLFTVVRGNGPRIDLRLEWRWADVKIGVKLGLLGLVLTTVSAFVWTRAVGQNDATSAITSLVDDQPMSVTSAIIMFCYLSVLGPVCEEIIYRGLLWGAVERLPWGKQNAGVNMEKRGRLVAFLISTAVFAVSHLEPMRTTLLLVIAVPIGLARLMTGRLLGAVVAHAMNNFLPALTLLLTTLGVSTL